MSGRFRHLDGLRGVAALVVVLSHSLIAFDFALFTGSPTQSVTSWDVWLSGAPFQIPIMANLSVCLFFAMSGFVLIGAFDSAKMGPILLLGKRYLRLTIPISAVCIASYLMLSAGLMTNHQAATISRSGWLDIQFQQSPSLVGALRESIAALFHNFEMVQSYDSSLWTMPMEFGGSVGVALVCFAAKFCKAAVNRRAAYIALSLALYVVFAQSYLGLFAAGALMRQAAPYGWQWLNNKPRIAAGLCLAGLFVGTVPESAAAWHLFAVFPRFTAPEWVPWPANGSALWHSIGAIALLLGLQSSQAIQRALLSPLCQWLGGISFPLYLVHVPILMGVGCRTFLAAHSAGVPYLGSAAMALLISVTVSLLSAHILTMLIERRAIQCSDVFARWAQRCVRTAATSPA